MATKIIALGRKSVISRVARSLTGSGVDLIGRTDLAEAIDLLKKEKFDLALVDGYLNDFETIRYRINWECGTPIALVINGSPEDWNLLRSLDIDGFIPEEVRNIDLAAYFESIVSRGKYQPRKIKALVIEGEEPTREELRRAFQTYWPEAEVFFAACGQDGIKSAENGPADVILLDLILPDISGYDVLDKIRTFSRTPVIIISSTRNQEDVVKSVVSGANDFVIKPFKPVELISRIRHLVDLKAVVSKN
jgi:DNA-binding response OmpR family regulator